MTTLRSPRKVVAGRLGHQSLTVYKLIYTFQFLTLLLPRDGGTAAIVYAAPLITTIALLLSGQFRVKLASSLALVALVIPSLLYVTIGQGGALNLALSLATYSGLYLLVLAPTSYTGEERLRYWERLVLFVAVVVVTIGLAQLVSKGFPIRLPYIDYSPDVFVGPYGAGGHRLVPIVVAPALFLQVLRVTTGVASYLRSLLLIALLAFGAIAPGANAMILAIALAVCVQATTVMARRAFSTLDLGGYFASRKGLLQAVAVGGLAVTLSASFFVVTGLGSLPHVTKSIESLIGVNEGTGPRNAKVAATIDTLVELPSRKPLQPAIGVGLGNYSSWSQLLLSGVYVDRFLSGRVGALPISYDETAWDLVLWHISPEAFQLHGRWYVESISTQPWSSWQSLYAETGLWGLILLLAIAIPLLRRLVVYSTDSRNLVAAKYALGTYAWLVLICGFIDNFFEYPWLLVPLILGLLVVPRHTGEELDAGVVPP